MTAFRPPARQHPKAHLAPVTDEPIAGFYRAKLVRGGPWVAVRIWHGPPLDPDTGEELDRSWRWQAERNGEPCEVWRVWPYCAGEPIDKAEHDYLLQVRDWAVQHAPETPEAAPTTPIAFNRLPIPF